MTVRRVGQSTRRDRRGDIHQAAARVFGAKGFAAASIQDIADEVGGLAKGSLYHYISSKQELLDRIFDDAQLQTTRFMHEVSAMDAPPAERLRRLIEIQIGWDLDHVEQSRVVLRERRLLTGRRAAVVSRRRERYEAFLGELIAHAQADGEIDRSVDVRLALRFILGAIDAAPGWYRSTGSDGPKRIAAVYADLSMGSLRGPARPAAGSRSSASVGHP